MSLKSLVLATSVLCIATTCHAGAYVEHKAIGDRGVITAQTSQLDRETFNALCRLAELHIDSLSVWLELGQGLSISYGDLAALAGDHTLTAFELESSLSSPRSYLHSIIRLQHAASEEGHFSASNLSVALRDSRYLSLALNNFSHFYNFGKTFTEHLDEVRLEEIDGLVAGNEEKLVHTNAIAKYCTLHAAALMLAEKGSSILHDRMSEARLYFRRAFILNAFADHFLQDAFAPGHLVLRRTVVGSYLTDLQLHDYYNKQGLQVVNLRKDRWTSYGDDEMFLHRDGSRNTELAIEATAVSVAELLNACVQRGSTFTQAISEAASTYTVSKFFSSHFKALSIIPIPFGSVEEIEILGKNDQERDELSVLNTLDHEGPVVSRLGIEVVGGLNTDLSKDYAAAIYGGLSLKGIGFDKDYSVGSAWHNIGIKVEHELKPHGRSMAWLEYQNVSNDHRGLRSILPFDFLLGAGLGFGEHKSYLFRAGVFIDYLPLQARPSSMISKLDPRLRILLDAGPSTVSDPGLFKRLLFGIELNLNQIIDLSLLPRY